MVATSVATTYSKVISALRAAAISGASLYEGEYKQQELRGTTCTEEKENSSSCSGQTKFGRVTSP